MKPFTELDIISKCFELELKGIEMEMAKAIASEYGYFDYSNRLDFLREKYLKEMLKLTPLGKALGE